MRHDAPRNQDQRHSAEPPTNQGFNGSPRIETGKINGRFAGYYNTVANFISPNIVKDTTRSAGTAKIGKGFIRRFLPRGMGDGKHLTQTGPAGDLRRVDRSSRRGSAIAPAVSCV